MPRPQAETRLRKQLAAQLERAGFRIVKIHGGPYQEAGLPDLLCLRGGRALWIEVKMPGEEPTALQRRKLDDLAAAGCVAGVARNGEDVKRLIAEFEAARYGGELRTESKV